MGFSEMLLISLLAFLLFGPKKTSELARQLGQHVAHFKRAASDLQSQVAQSLDLPPEALGSETIDGLRQTITGVLASGLTVPPIDAAYDGGESGDQKQSNASDLGHEVTVSPSDSIGSENAPAVLAGVLPPQVSENTYA